MTDLATTARVTGTQVGYQLRVFRRTPVAAFFTLILPIMMLVLFNALFADGTVETPAGSWPTRQFYTGGLAAFAAVSATYTNLANTVPILRDDGVLKRWRSTPLPPAAYVAGMVASAVVIEGKDAQGQSDLCAYFISNTGSTITAADLRDHLAREDRPR